MECHIWCRMQLDRTVVRHNCRLDLRLVVLHIGVLAEALEGQQVEAVLRNYLEVVLEDQRVEMVLRNYLEEQEDLKEVVHRNY